MIGRPRSCWHLADRPRRLVAVHLRHHHVHQHQVDVGGRRRSSSSASRPFSANDHLHAVAAPARWSARRCCARRRPRSARARPRTRRRRCAAAPASSLLLRAGRASTRCRNSAVSSSSRSGDFDVLHDDRLGVARSCVSSCRRELLAGVDDDRQVATLGVALDPLQQLEARSCRAARGRAPCSRSAASSSARSASSALSTAVISTSVVADQLDDAACAAPSSSSTTSSVFTRRVDEAGDALERLRRAPPCVDRLLEVGRWPRLQPAAGARRRRRRCAPGCGACPGRASAGRAPTSRRPPAGPCRA